MDRRPAYYTYPQLWRLHVKDRWYLNRSHKCPVIFFSGIIKRRFVRDFIVCIAACRFITQRWFWSPFSCWLLLLYAQNSCITVDAYMFVHIINFQHSVRPSVFQRSVTRRGSSQCSCSPSHLSLIYYAGPQGVHPHPLWPPSRHLLGLTSTEVASSENNQLIIPK